MNKTDLVRSVTAEVKKDEGLSISVNQKNIGNVIDVLLDTITDALTIGEEVKFLGFGKLYTVEKEARVGKNPQTGEELKIPAHKIIKFKASKTLKQTVNL